MKTLKVLKFEIKNILRSRWIFGYFIMTTLISTGLNYLTSDPSKVLISLALIFPILVPLVGLIFSTLHWYYNERFTVLLLTQPVSRQTVLLSRYIALGVALSLAVTVGILLPFILRQQWPMGLNLLLATVIVLTFIFVGVALLISTLIEDRLKGIGFAFASWIYLSLLHDGILLVLLILFRDTPMDLIAGAISGFNPISLSRVVQLMYFDQALLLGHTGALTKQILISWKGYALAVTTTVLWLFLPLIGTFYVFKKKNL
jgi:Cu-processing system permease protein